MSINRFPTISTRRAERSSRNPELPEESLTSDSSDRTEHETVQILPVVRWLCATPHGDGGKMASLVPCVAGKHFFRVDSRNCRSLSRNLINQRDFASKGTAYANVRWHSECARCTSYDERARVCLRCFMASNDSRSPRDYSQ